MSAAEDLRRRRELRAQFRDLAEAEAERAERECPLVHGSDAALELKALAGDSLADIVRNRLAREQDPAA